MKRLILFLLVAIFLSAATGAYAAIELPSTKTHQEGLKDYTNHAQVSMPVTVLEAVTDWLSSLLLYAGDPHAAPATTVLEQQQFFRNSVTGKLTEGIADLYLTKPADTKLYLADLGARAGIVTPAFAQGQTGIGFAGLTPLLSIWKGFRNIAYGFLILVMVVIGFMVLFRMKIDPRTVISVQNALPRIIVTLFLITFSYAIVGLLIDAMYLLLFLLLAVLQGAAGISPSQFPHALQIATGGPIANLYGSLYPLGNAAVDDIVVMIGGATVNGVLSVLLPTVSGLLAGGVINGLVVGGAVGAATAAAGGGANVLVSVLVWLAIIFTLIRIFFMLVNAYIQIIVGVIFGPLQLMFGAIPNTNAFGSWFRGLASNLIVFPVTTGMLMIGSILASLAGTQNLWTPPGLGGSGLQAGVSGIIGLGIAFSIPTVANAIKELLKAKPIVPGGTGAVFAPITSVYGTAMGGVSQLYYLQSLRGMLPKWLGGGQPK